MESTSQDLRVRRTRATIRSTFDQLIRENGAERITVKELAERAGINRKTFYLHYSTIDALYQERLEEVLDQYFEQHEITPDEPEDIGGHAVRFFRFLASQDAVTEQLICRIGYYDFGRRLYREQMRRYRMAGNPFGWMDEGRQDLVLHFIRATALDFYRRWVQSGKTVSSDDAAALLAELTCNGVSGLMR